MIDDFLYEVDIQVDGTVIDWFKAGLLFEPTTKVMVIVYPR